MSVQTIGGDFGATMILAPLDICPPGRTLLYKRGCDIDIRLSPALVLISVAASQGSSHFIALPRMVARFPTKLSFGKKPSPG
jgi:hypothetical protein